MARETQTELLSMFYAVVETEGREPTFGRKVAAFRTALGIKELPE